MSSVPGVIESDGIAVVDYQKLELTRLENGISYRPVTVDDLGISLMVLPIEAHVEYHHHDDAQTTYVLQGKLRFFVKFDEGERVFEVGPGTLVGVPGGVVHRLEVLEPAQVIECWSPSSRHRAAAVVAI